MLNILKNKFFLNPAKFESNGINVFIISENQNFKQIE